MSPRAHLSLLGQGVGAWVLFFVLGLPDYYQQYPAGLVGAGSVLISVGISLLAVVMLRRGTPQTRMRRALWASLYFTVPLALLDTLYCGLYLGHGAGYLATYWYLSIFYLSPWLTFPPTALLLSR